MKNIDYFLNVVFDKKGEYSNIIEQEIGKGFL